jgi:hypothetical protein
MRKVLGPIAVIASVGLAACDGGGAVTVQASVERADGSTTALTGLLVRALPYDRDQLFEELERRHGVPEPDIPDSLGVLQDAIARAQAEWSSAQTIWNAARDSLKALSDGMQVMNRASAEYTEAYQAFIEQEALVERTEAQSRSAYSRFEELQQRYNQQADSVRLARSRWADAAFAQVDSAIRARVREAGRREYADTTDANGIVSFPGLERGRYWIYARYDQPYDELYWNLPVEATSTPATVQLNRQSAQVRPKL